MLRAAISFFIIGLVAVLLGAYNIGGLSIELGKTLLFVFLILAALSFLGSMFSGRKTAIGPLAIFAFLASGLAAWTGHGLVVTSASADETVTQKIEDKKDEADASVKKSVRKAKRGVRKAKGTDSVLKDAQDKMNDVGDDFSADAQKTKRKLSQ